MIITPDNELYLKNRAIGFTSLAHHKGYLFTFTPDSHKAIRTLIWATQPVDNTDVRIIEWCGQTVYAHAWRPKNPSGDIDGDIVVNLLSPATAKDSIELASHGLDRVWHDGLGGQRVGYSQHDVADPDPECVHELEGTSVKVFFFAGGHYRDMKRCVKCDGFVSVDMADHPKGRHEWGDPDAEGFCPCAHCKIKISAMPAMWIGSTSVCP